MTSQLDFQFLNSSFLKKSSQLTHHRTHAPIMMHAHACRSLSATTHNCMHRTVHLQGAHAAAVVPRGFGRLKHDHCTHFEPRFDDGTLLCVIACPGMQHALAHASHRIELVSS